jgi:ribokinase
MQSGRDMPSIVALGDINVDVLMDVPAYPTPGGEALTERILTQLGGSAANTAVVLSRLGLEVRLIARVGGDAWGQIAREQLAETGVSLEFVQQDATNPTGMMFTVVTPDGERTMFGQRGANRELDAALISSDALGGVDLLYLSGYALLEAPQREAAARAVELARQRKLPVVLDTAYLPAIEVPRELRKLLPVLDACILGLPEALALLGEEEPELAAAALSRAGVPLAAVKLGRQGCLLADASASHFIPAFPVQAVDTTGAGDAFTAGVIFGRTHGLSLPATGILANALGGLAASVHGAGTALPGRDEAVHLLDDNLPDSTEERYPWMIEVLHAIA